MKRTFAVVDSAARKARRVDAPGAVGVYLSDPLARRAVNALFRFGAQDALEAVREGGRNPFQPLLADAGVLAMDPEAVLHPARLVEAGLQRPWTRSRTARARELVAALPGMPAAQSLDYLSDGALLALLQYAADAVRDATGSDRPRGRFFRGEWLDHFRAGEHVTPMPLALTADRDMARTRGGVDVDAATEPRYVWEVELDGTAAALVGDGEVVLPAGTVLVSQGCRGGVCAVRVAPGETLRVAMDE